jgi:hypothetical protein
MLEPYPLGVSDRKERRAPRAEIRLHLPPMHPGARLGPIPDAATRTAHGAGDPCGLLAGGL